MTAIDDLEGLFIPRFEKVRDQKNNAALGGYSSQKRDSFLNTGALASRPEG